LYKQTILGRPQKIKGSWPTRSCWLLACPHIHLRLQVLCRVLTPVELLHNNQVLFLHSNSNDPPAMDIISIVTILNSNHQLLHEPVSDQVLLRTKYLPNSSPYMCAMGPHSGVCRFLPIIIFTRFTQNGYL